MHRTIVKASLAGAAALAALLLLVLATQPLGVLGQQGGAPAALTGLTGNVYHDQVELTWDAPGDSSITGYRILRLDRAVHGLGNFQVHVSDTGSAEASYTDTRVEASTRYVYRIKARYGDDIGPRSSYFNADTPPAAPTGLTGTAEHDRVSLSWDAPGDGSITGYQVLRGNRVEGVETEFQVLANNTGSSATTYVDTGVEPETGYAYRVRARNRGGIGPPSADLNADTPAEPETPDPPAAPTGLTGTAEHDRVSLSWDDPGDDSISGYQVLRGNRVEGVETQFAVIADDTGSGRTSYVDTDVEPETGYAYLVRARNAGGLGPPSGDFDTDTPALSPPGAPVVTAIHPFSSVSVVVEWKQDPPDDTITGYQILRGADAVSLAVILEDTGPDWNHSSDGNGPHWGWYSDATAPAGQTVWYAVQARNAAGLSPQSNAFEAAIPSNDPPAAPTGLTGTAKHDRVSLSWDDPGDRRITGYQVLRGDRVEGVETQFAVIADDTGSARTSYADTGVEPETAYAYRIRARNVNGLGTPSGDFDADTPAAPPVPAAPNLMNTAKTQGQVLLLWEQDPADDSITGYRILRGDSQDSLSEIEADTGSAGTTYADTDPPAGQTVWYAVQARNANGLSPPSNSLSVDVPAAETEEEPLVSGRQESEITLLSNIGNSRGAEHIATSLLYAQRFTTGPNPDGYHLTRIQIRMRTPTGTASGHVLIRSGDRNPTTATVHRLTQQGTMNTTARNITFRAEPEAHLEPNTIYWVVFVRDTGLPRLEYTNAGSVSTRAPGWQRGPLRQCNSSFSCADSSTLMKLRIYGQVVPPPLGSEPTGEDLPLSTDTTGFVTTEYSVRGSLTDPEDRSVMDWDESDQAFRYRRLRGDRFRLDTEAGKRYRLTAEFEGTTNTSTAGSISVIRVDHRTGESAGTSTYDHFYDDGRIFADFKAWPNETYYVDVETTGLDRDKDDQNFSNYTLSLEDISDVLNVTRNDIDNPSDEDTAFSLTGAIKGGTTDSLALLQPIVPGYRSNGYYLDKIVVLLDDIQEGATPKIDLVTVDLMDDITVVCTLAEHGVRQPSQSYEGSIGHAFEFLAGGCADTTLESRERYNLAFHNASSTASYKMVMTSKYSGYVVEDSGWLIIVGGSTTSSDYGTADPFHYPRQ